MPLGAVTEPGQRPNSLFFIVDDMGVITLEMNRAIVSAVAAGRPFFAYMSHYAVHAPFDTDARFSGNYPDLEGMPLAFATLVEGMDKSLGDIIAHLERLGVAESTLVIFTSDNGSDGPLNLPLRGKKGTRFEGGTRVPLIVAWAKPNLESPLQQVFPIAPGTESDSFVVSADFFPTLAAIAGVGIPDDLALDGHDLSAALTGRVGPVRPREFLVHFPHGSTKPRTLRGIHPKTRRNALVIQSPEEMSGGFGAVEAAFGGALRLAGVGSLKAPGSHGSSDGWPPGADPELWLAPRTVHLQPPSANPRG